MTSKKHSKQNAREAAYLAVLGSLRGEGFIHEYLDRWQQTEAPKSTDLHFAKEIAYGTARMALALDYLAQQLSDKKKLQLKLKEKVLLRTAIYQWAFLDRVPLYAIANETITIAKRHCHQTFVGFLNALMQKMNQSPPQLPQGKTIQELSIRYSYPPIYIEMLINDYGILLAENILQLGNQAASTIVRIRPSVENPTLPSGLKLISHDYFQMARLEDRNLLKNIVSSPNYYIQNATPAALIAKLCRHTESPPHHILDLCASPGGKILAAHDFFPLARLTANDISPEKINSLKENFSKYEVKVNLTCSRGEEYQSTERYDIIILDVPCSNTGVLNKRPEARWRLSLETLKELETIQLALIQNAARLLTPLGSIWYMTCSLLKEENERLIQKACQLFDLSIDQFQETILPNAEGWDGGFACILKKGKPQRKKEKN